MRSSASLQSAHRYFCLKGISLHPHFVLYLASLYFFLLSSSVANLKQKRLLLCTVLAVVLPVLITSDLLWLYSLVLAMECCSIRCIKFTFHFSYVQHHQLISFTAAVSLPMYILQAGSCPLPFHITQKVASCWPRQLGDTEAATEKVPRAAYKWPSKAGGCMENSSRNVKISIVGEQMDKSGCRNTRMSKQWEKGYKNGMCCWQLD